MSKPGAPYSSAPHEDPDIDVGELLAEIDRLKAENERRKQAQEEMTESVEQMRSNLVAAVEDCNAALERAEAAEARVREMEAWEVTARRYRVAWVTAEDLLKRGTEAIRAKANSKKKGPFQKSMAKLLEEIEAFNELSAAEKAQPSATPAEEPPLPERRGYDRALMDLAENIANHEDFGPEYAGLVYDVEMKVRAQQARLRRMGDEERCHGFVGHAYGGARCRLAEGHRGECDFRPLWSPDAQPSDAPAEGVPE